MSQRSDRWLPGQRARISRQVPEENHCCPWCGRGRRAWRRRRGVRGLVALLLLFVVFTLLLLRVVLLLWLFLSLWPVGPCLWWHWLCWRWRGGLVWLRRRRRCRHWGWRKWRRQGWFWLYWRCRDCGTRRRCWRWRRGGRGRGRGGRWGRRRGVPKGSPIRWSEVISWNLFKAILGGSPVRHARHVCATVYFDGHGGHRMAATAATHCNEACLPTTGRTRKRPCILVSPPLAHEVLPRGHVRAIPWHAEASACQAARTIWLLGHRARQRPSRRADAAPRAHHLSH